MGELVRLKSTNLCGLIAALIAAEGLLATVGEHVPLEAYILCAGITALVTGEGLL